jgi:hypothetical protein
MSIYFIHTRRLETAGLQPPESTPAITPFMLCCGNPCQASPGTSLQAHLPCVPDDVLPPWPPSTLLFPLKKAVSQDPDPTVQRQCPESIWWRKGDSETTETTVWWQHWCPQCRGCCKLRKHLSTQLQPYEVVTCISQTKKSRQRLHLSEWSWDPSQVLPVHAAVHIWPYLQEAWVSDPSGSERHAGSLK